MTVAELSPTTELPTLPVAPLDVPAPHQPEHPAQVNPLPRPDSISEADWNSKTPQQQQGYLDAPGYGDSVAEQNKFIGIGQKPVDPEVERLMRFDRAVEERDAATIESILNAAEKASAKTGSSEFQYLTERFNAAEPGTSGDVTSRRQSLDKAAEAGDDATIQAILAEAGNDKERKNLTHRLAWHDRQAMERAVQKHDGQAQSFILDRAYNKAKATQEPGDLAEYSALVDRLFQKSPDARRAAQQRMLAFRQANARHDVTAIDALLDWTEQQGQKTGFWHEYNRLQDEMLAQTPRQSPESQATIQKPAPGEKTAPRLPRRFLAVGQFLLKELRTQLLGYR